MSAPSETDHSLLATLVLPVAQALRHQGWEPLAVFEQVGLDMARAANPDWRVPRRTFAALLARCVELSGDEAFGLAAAEQLQPQALHALGLAWLASDTVYDGLRRMARFMRFVSTGATLRLVEEEGFVRAILRAGALPRDVVEPASQDYAVGVLVRMCQLTLGEFLAPSGVELARPAPQDPERWEYMLSSRVQFDCPQTRIPWPLAEIAEPLATGDPVLARINDEQAQAYLDSFLDHSTTRDVVDCIVQALPDGVPGQSAIASALHMSQRSLQRKLRQEGASFSDLVQDTRLALARKYLREQRRSVLETAYLLGFSEPSTFSRAFKRWTGSAPADFRDAG